MSSALLAGTGRLALDEETASVLYAAMEPGTLISIDVSTPTAPAVVGSVSDAEVADPT